MTMEGPQGKAQVDSDSPEAPRDAVGKALDQVMKGTSGLKITATISATGAFSDVKVDEQTIKKLRKTPAFELFGDLLSADGIQRMVRQSELPLPQEAVEKGRSWKSESTGPLPGGKIIREIEYTYAGTTNKDGRVLAKINLTPKARIEANENAAVALKLKSQEGTGNALFDIGAGRLLEVTSRQTMEMEIEVMGQTFSQRMAQSTTMRLAAEK